jgi:glyoxylase-like metal-dependent hydrolase (beta-lactamase superfamily II)
VEHPSIDLATIRIDVVCEGYAPLDLADEMSGVDWAREGARYPWAFHGERSWAWHVHAFALRTPGGLVMVDAGVSPFPPYRPWAEHTPLEKALEGAGVEPAEVRAVIHTHLHADHAGGAVVDGEPRFPNARHVVHPADWEHFALEPEGYNARGAMGRLPGFALDLDPEDREVWPGIRVVHAPGHTPGHRSVVLEDGAQTLLFAGDLLHLPIQVRLPGHPSDHDLDPELGARSRVRLLCQAADGAWDVAVSHFGRPFGRVGLDGWEARPPG